MTLKNLIESKLEIDRLFRERSKKDQGIVSLLRERYPALNGVSVETLVACVQEYASMDRCWRKALEDHEELRGSDYDQKDELEAKKMAELGYNVPREVGAGDAVAESNQQRLL